jgi:quercetin dioxygenase-like cupin family protein
MPDVSVVLDAVSADPKHYTVEDENERLRIVRVRYGPGEKSVMHTHPDLVSVFVTDADVRFTLPDGSSEEAHPTAGQAMFMPATTHLPENVGDSPLEVLLIELKR